MYIYIYIYSCIPVRCLYGIKAHSSNVTPFFPHPPPPPPRLPPDIDECSVSDVCASQSTGHECTNTPGSFECSCPSGYQFSEERMCTGKSHTIIIIRCSLSLTHSLVILSLSLSLSLSLFSDQPIWAGGLPSVPTGVKTPRRT